MHTQPDISRIPSFYHKYISYLTLDKPLPALLMDEGNKTMEFLKSLPQPKWSYRYAPGKWSIKEVVLHMIDTERIFAYRALSFARNEQAQLPGYDENTYAIASGAEERTAESLLEEFQTVQQATYSLFKNFTDDQMDKNGIANNNNVYVRGIGFIIVGHALHHMHIIKERYL